jgi:predicted enzyme related to lactoylglutathione lyase
VDDLDAELSRLAAQGVWPFEGPLKLPDLAYWTYVEDPDGNVIEYVQWLNPAYTEPESQKGVSP